MKGDTFVRKNVTQHRSAAREHFFVKCAHYHVSRGCPSNAGFYYQYQLHYIAMLLNEVTNKDTDKFWCQQQGKSLFVMFCLPNKLNFITWYKKSPLTRDDHREDYGGGGTKSPKFLKIFEIFLKRCLCRRKRLLFPLFSKIIGGPN